VAFILLVIVLFVQNQIRYMLLYLKREIGIQMAMGAFYKDIIIIWLYQYAKHIFYGMIAGSGMSFVLIKLLLLSNTESVLNKMIATDFNFDIFIISSGSLIICGILYIYYKIRSFLKNSSIIGLMSND
ncbi:MAG: hypothetical protein KKD38_06040, partial [Candidatus Delongbacteria bacterium]|nr:hypothetical protein [Candidatus Delongbacteria bacterium]MCG2760346.1 hypothetical protein [Candidatus Delongbacteria bacterium]